MELSQFILPLFALSASVVFAAGLDLLSKYLLRLSQSVGADASQNV